MEQEPQVLLNTYIHDYFVKMKWDDCARALEQQVDILPVPVINYPDSAFLLDWWSIFWDAQADVYRKRERPIAPEQHESQHQSQGPNGTPGSIPGNLQESQNPNRLPPRPTPDMRRDMNPMMNRMAAGPQGSVIGSPGSSPGQNNSIPSGRPPTGNGHRRPLVTPQQRQQILRARQGMDYEMITMLAKGEESGLGTVNMIVPNGGSDVVNEIVPNGGSNVVNVIVPNGGSPMPLGCHGLPNGGSIMLGKQQLQNNNPQQQQNSQSQLLNQLSDSMSNFVQGNDQKPPKKKSGRPKKKILATPSGPATSTDTATTADGGFAPPALPTHTAGDAVSVPANDSSSRPSLMFESNVGAYTPVPNYLVEMHRYANDEILDYDIEVFLSNEEAALNPDMGVSEGFTFNEIAHIEASTCKINSCDFSSDGKLLATGGDDCKVVLWHTDTLNPKDTLTEHSGMITEVRFSPSTSWLATACSDGTFRVWDVNKTGSPARTFKGHLSSISSLDFHPTNEELICSNDNYGEIRIWDIITGTCPHILMGGEVQVRFQPRHAKYIAAVQMTNVNVLKADTRQLERQLQGHTKSIRMACWDSSGEFLAGLSDEKVIVWRIGSESDRWPMVYELDANGNHFNTCVFHPRNDSILVIGCYQNLEVCNMKEDKTMTVPAHKGEVSSLAASHATGMIASASHDMTVKLWK